MVSCVEGVDGAIERAREDAGGGLLVGGGDCVRCDVLADALVIPLTPKQSMDNHYRITLRFPIVIVEFIR